MNLVYHKISSFSFFSYFPLSFEPSIESDCTGRYREGLHVGLVCNFLNLIPRTSGYEQRSWWLGADVSNW